MDRTYSQAVAEMLGLKLQQASKLDEQACTLQLASIIKEMREALITLGVRKRRVKAKGEEKAAAKKRK